MIKERIQKRLADLGLNQFEAAKKAGRDTHFIYDLLEGKKKSIKGKGLEQVAEVLQCSIEYLTGASTEIGSPPSGGQNSHFSKIKAASAVEISPAGAADLSGLPDSGQIEPDVFRRAASMQPSGRMIPVEPDARYPKNRQKAFVNRGQGLAAVGIHDGMIITAVDVDVYEEETGRLGHGALVVLQFSRNDGREIELSVRQLREFPDRIEFIGCGIGIHIDTITIRDDKIERDGELCSPDTNIKFLGVVVKATVIL